MSKKGETRVHQRIQDRLKAEFRGSFFFKTHGSIFQIAGLPDLIGCVSGMFFGFEVKDPKRPRSKASPLQKEIMKRIQDAGGFAGVIETPEQAVEIVRYAQQASISGSRSLPLRVWLRDSIALRSEDGKDSDYSPSPRTARAIRRTTRSSKD